MPQPPSSEYSFTIRTTPCLIGDTIDLHQLSSDKLAKWAVAFAFEVFCLITWRFVTSNIEFTSKRSELYQTTNQGTESSDELLHSQIIILADGVREGRENSLNSVFIVSDLRQHGIPKLLDPGWSRHTDCAATTYHPRSTHCLSTEKQILVVQRHMSTKSSSCFASGLL